MTKNIQYDFLYYINDALWCFFFCQVRSCVKGTWFVLIILENPRAHTTTRVICSTDLVSCSVWELLSL